jgi:hypothetical protein
LLSPLYSVHITEPLYASEQVEWSRGLESGSPGQRQAWLDLEILADNLQVSPCVWTQGSEPSSWDAQNSLQLQSQHLNQLSQAPDKLIIPVDIRQSSTDPQPGRARRRVVDTVNRAKVDRVPSKFMTGPEPSWIRAKRNAKSTS